VPFPGVKHRRLVVAIPCADKPRVARRDGPFDRAPGAGWSSPTQIAQIPAYQAYPPSGEAEPKPLPNGLSVSVRVRRVMYLTFL
jgi:hypothetical protein